MVTEGGENLRTVMTVVEARGIQVSREREGTKDNVCLTIERVFVGTEKFEGLVGEVNGLDGGSVHDDFVIDTVGEHGDGIKVADSEVIVAVSTPECPDFVTGDGIGEVTSQTGG